MTVEERMKPAMHFKPELASLNMGSMNFGLFPMLKRHNQLKYPWEKKCSKEVSILFLKILLRILKT